MSRRSHPVGRRLFSVLGVLPALIAGCGGLTDNGVAGVRASGGTSTGGRGAPAGGTLPAGGSGAGGTGAPGCSGPLWVRTDQDLNAGFGADALAVGDFNRDGNPDLVANADPAYLSVLLGHGNGSFDWRVLYDVGSRPWSPVVADLNRDGALDLAFTGLSGTGVAGASVVLGNGDGSFGGRADYATCSNPWAVRVADFNLDGAPDLVALCDVPWRGLNVLLGNGDGTFADAMYFESSRTADSLDLGDFNLDGKPDLALANPGGVDVVLGNGDGTFADGSHHGVPPGGEWSSLTAADLNVDGKADLALITGGPFGRSNLVSVFLGHGDGTFATGADYDTGLLSAAPAVGDFNLDGALDLVLLGGGGVGALFGNGDGTFTDHVHYDLGVTASRPVVADFNLDGKPGLAMLDPAELVATGIIILLGHCSP